MTISNKTNHRKITVAITSLAAVLAGSNIASAQTDSDLIIQVPAAVIHISDCVMTNPEWGCGDEPYKDSPYQQPSHPLPTQPPFKPAPSFVIPIDQPSARGYVGPAENESNGGDGGE